jgi:hypothetical protein
VSLIINDQLGQSVTTQGRQLYLPIPAITAEDTVTLKARSLGQKKSDSSVIEHSLTAREKQQICSIPLRVFAVVQASQVTGRCEILPGIIEGELEYAFYLLVDGRKSQVRWYEPSPTHCFTLTSEEAGKPVRLRGFVRNAAAPEQKLSAMSGMRGQCCT